MTVTCRSSSPPICSWVDPHHVCERLDYLPFPGLPKLLLSTTHLTQLELHEIPDSGYIAPEAMVACISTLTRLESFNLDLQSHEPRSEWGRRRTHSPTRALLPSLTCFTFMGASEYLEDIVDGIDTPLLDKLSISFFHQPTGIFHTPRLTQFISRLPELKTCNEARMCLRSFFATVKITVFKTTTNASFMLESYDRHPYFQLPPFVHLCTSSPLQVLVPTVERLTISGSNFNRPLDQDHEGTDPNLWRELLQPFTAVKDLYLLPEVAPRIALVMQKLVRESMTESLPALQNILLKEKEPSRRVLKGITQFVAARQLAGHPIHFSLE